MILTNTDCIAADNGLDIRSIVCLSLVPMAKMLRFPEMRV